MSVRVMCAVCLVLFLAGCGGGGESSVPAAPSAVAKVEAKSPSAAIDPCAVLSADLIRRHFEVGDAGITSRASTNTHHPLCTVTWPKANKEQLEKDMQAKMSEYMMARARGEDVKMPSFQTDDEVSLTINMPPSENDEAAAAALQSAMKQLEQGFRDKDNPDAPPRFQYDTEPVEGVADGAFWTPGLSQLSARGGTYIFHVTVRTGDAATNQEKARAVAADVADALRR